MTPTFRPPRSPHDGFDKKGFTQENKPSPDRAKRTATILVVDDEAMIIKVMRRVLGRGGREVKTAENGKQGLEIFKTGGIDLVVSDFHMEEMNGLAMLKEIKKLEPDAKVIIMTADATKAEREELIDAGALIVLDKPFETSALMDIVEYALSK